LIISVEKSCAVCVQDGDLDSYTRAILLLDWKDNDSGVY